MGRLRIPIDRLSSLVVISKEGRGRAPGFLRVTIPAWPLMTSPGKLSVLRLYPELAGRVAQRGALSSESAQEHISAGLTNLTDEERQKMTDLNQR